jgi:hypothetical protein
MNVSMLASNSTYTWDTHHACMFQWVRHVMHAYNLYMHVRKHTQDTWMNVSMLASNIRISPSSSAESSLAWHRNRNISSSQVHIYWLRFKMGFCSASERIRKEAWGYGRGENKKTGEDDSATETTGVMMDRRLVFAVVAQVTRWVS